MGKFVKTGSKYSDQQRMEVAVLYAIHGNMKKVARQSGIPRTTIISWQKQDWWDELISQVRSAKVDEHRAMYSQLVDAAQAQALAKLPEATAAQSMVIAGIATDKLYRADNLPGTLTGSAVSIDDLAKEFNKLANKNVVSVQTKNDETEETEEIE